MWLTALPSLIRMPHINARSQKHSKTKPFSEIQSNESGSLEGKV